MCQDGRVALPDVFTVWNVLWEAFLSLLKFPVVSINKIHLRCSRDCRRDRNFSISATLVAAVVLVATIAEEYVSIYRHRRRNTFFDDSGDSSDGSDYMETGLYITTSLREIWDAMRAIQGLQIICCWWLTSRQGWTTLCFRANASKNPAKGGHS